MTGRDAIEERLRHARRDLEELTTQLEVGEIDPETAARLRERYERDVAQAERQLEAIPPPPKPPRKAPAPAPEGVGPKVGGSRRALWIMGAAMAALTVVIIVMARSGGSDAPEAAVLTAPLDAGVSGGGFAELEAAVAADPTNNAMRLELAGMYFEIGEYVPAVEHYLAVIDGEALPQERSVALGRVGFLAYVTEQYDAAVQYLEEGIAADPDNGENFLFMGVVQLYGIGDPEEAIPNFEAVLALPDCTASNISPCIPPELRLDVEAMLEEARAAGGDG